MVAPREIIDFLESILSIFLYDIRQKERSVFILVDNLVELSCKARIRERGKIIKDQKELKDFLKLANVGGELKKRLTNRRKERNTMQHDLVAVTVSHEHCADSILDLLELIKKLWGKYAFDGVDEWVDCAFRVVKLYSRSTSKKKKEIFENRLIKEVNWGLESSLNINGNTLKGIDIEIDGTPLGRRLPNDDEMIVSIKSPELWVIVIREHTLKVQSCLDELDITME
jgi:hypothetical protein